MDQPASEALTSPAANEIPNVQDNILNLNVKYTLTKARTVDNHTLTDEELTSPNQIPHYILKTLMIANYHARDFELKPLTSDKNRNKTKDNSSDERAGENESEDNDLDENDNRDVGVNPMDALLWLFYHSDTFLRRALAIKLSACQLSVPFLLPDPPNSKNVTILLSALESITKCWKGAYGDNDSTREVFATEYPFPVVSFIRIGKKTMSKSFWINKIMSNGDRDHDFFFHKNIQGGHVKRKLVDGLVELSWYLPGESEKQAFQKEICFANLRGEATLFKKQVDVLLKISSVLCVLLPSDNPDENITKMLKEVMQSKAKVILIFNEKNQGNTNNFFKDLKKKTDKKLSLITKANKLNEYSFLKSVRETIQRNVHEVKPTPLVELASCAHQYGICLDDDQSNFKLDKNMETWLKLGVENAKNFLKLQKHVPMLSVLEREKYCPKRDTDEIYENIEAEKKAQRESFAQMDKGVCKYLDSIASMDEAERNYSLSKMKHQLDKMSLQIMAKLHQECRVASPTLSKKQLEELISKYSFGLEHIIREFAQLYQLGISTTDYAGAAAEMLLSGLPLELLDGDSSYIPLQWFNAVYRELERKTNNAKIFVISVLGIQSSGKSTMLNTMFGLEFPVSAGRCTRGAFASLIPVSDSLKFASGIDYILIIDTEGLRGSEDLYVQLREHDNELATFAIGIADVTIVNIFGQNHNDMKEFLGIAVHAFLKMKLVKEKKAFKIVHQNVVATDAADKLMVARCTLKQDLNKMTRVAAIQENCEFQALDDIVSFDENKDVFYIPCFLNGNAPMAPVNPGYGRAVEKIKENIITQMCSNHRFQPSVSQFRERVVSLWKAMLKENFIFSFRNTIEVRAYTSLDRKYSDESKLFVRGMSELESEIQVSLSRCQTRDERQEKWTACKKQIREEAEKLKEKMETEIKNFFEKSEDKETLEQWKENTMNKIKEFQESQLNTVTNNCFTTFNYWQKRQNFEDKMKNYEKKLLEKAKTFVSSTHINDVEKRKAVFEQEWQQWIAYVPECEESKINVNSEMVDVLCGNANQILNADMTEKLKHKDYWILNFKKIDPVIDLSQLSFSFINNLFNFDAHQPEEHLASAGRIKDKAVGAALEFAKMASKSKVRCTRNDLTQMYHQVINTINKETEKCCFEFRKCLKCDILLYIFAQVYVIFDQMENRYIEERDIRSELERNMRPKLETYFLNLCNRMKKQMLAATSIVDVLKAPMESKLNQKIGFALIEKLKTIEEYKDKEVFHDSVLIQLGKEENFESYIPYLENPVTFLSEKLMESIKNYCLKEKSTLIASLLKEEANEIKDTVFAAILTANKETKTKGMALTFWIQQFVENCSVLEIRNEMFAVAAIDDDLKEIDVLEANVRKNVTQFLDSLMKREVDEVMVHRWTQLPYRQMYTVMFGCQECCPFCNSLCKYSHNHESIGEHSATHRPQCLSGSSQVSLLKRETLNTKICTADVAGKAKFRNDDTSWEWHRYKNYKSVYKTWKIDPDTSFESSIYWQWFIATFSKELAKYYKAKEPKIPKTWKRRTFEEVKEQLQQKKTCKTSPNLATA